MTHRDKCLSCEQYTKHTVAASEKPTAEIPSHQIELAFQTAWPRVVECIEDDAVDEAHSKLSWYCDRYQDTVKNAKSLQEQLDSEKECRRKVESELHDLHKEVKGKRKQKETSASTTREWREWESASDSDMAEQMLSKSSRKRRRRDTGPPDDRPGGMTEFPYAEPMELGPHMVLPPVGSVPQAVPEPVVPAATVLPLSTLAPSLWGKGDPPASIMGKWPHPLGKTKTGQHPWHQACDINTVEFRNALQVARAMKGAERTLEQHAIINRINKHERY